MTPSVCGAERSWGGVSVVLLLATPQVRLG